MLTLAASILQRVRGFKVYVVSRVSFGCLGFRVSSFTALGRRISSLFRWLQVRGGSHASGNHAQHEVVRDFVAGVMRAEHAAYRDKTWGKKTPGSIFSQVSE